ncbi:MAG: FKBP-type peptidyl-prolyl cis-trans isomerase [Ilumatobacteraceae bacterium]
MRLPRPLRSRALAAAAIVLVVVSCGDEPESADSPTTDVSTTTPPTTAPTPTTTIAGSLPKPSVEIPATLPTELVVTDLVDGTGDAAAVGDTVVVHYVGVRSEDGTEFDNSYDRGAPYPVTIGTTSVIQGWTEGLVGVKQGGRRQLDIPADLAYGDSPQGDIIQAGDALTFVVDVVAVYGPADPADEPEITVEAAPNQEQIGIDDLVEGTGEVVQAGQTAVVHLIAFRADTGEKITSTWADPGQPFDFVVGGGEVLPGIELGVEDMAIGGRRQLHVPYLLAFGEEGNPAFGLPAKTDMVLIVDLVTAY